MRVPLASVRVDDADTHAGGFVVARELCERLLGAVGGLEVRSLLRLEAVYEGQPWSQPRCPISSVEMRDGSCRLLVAQPCHRNVAFFSQQGQGRGNATSAAGPGSAGTLVRIDNAPAGLTRANVTFGWAQLSDTRVLIRWPAAAAATPASRFQHSLLAPRSDGLLVAAALDMEGMRLVLSGWSAPLRASGFVETQAGFYAAEPRRQPRAAPRGAVCPVGAAVLAAAGSVRGCVFEALGGSGLHLLSGEASGNRPGFIARAARSAPPLGEGSGRPCGCSLPSALANRDCVRRTQATS